MLFEWDESKRQANLAKHHIDFQDAIRIFDGPVSRELRAVTVKTAYSPSVLWKALKSWWSM